MKKFLAGGIVGVMLISGIILKIGQKSYEVAKVTLGGTTISAFIADTPEKQSKGLGGRRSLGADEGMLFVFDTDAQYGFWMKDMRFPIDIMWIDDGKIVDIAPNVPPPTSDSLQLPSYLPRLPADTVLEVNAGFAQHNGVKIGDTVLMNQ